MQRPGVLTGAVVGLLLTAPLVALLFFAAQLAGLPFPPYDLFNWVTRILPGPLITFGIDVMVALIGALNVGETSAVAKLAEQTMAIVGVVLAGAAAGGALFAVRAGAWVGAALSRGRRSAVAIDPTMLWSANNPLPRHLTRRREG